MGTTGKWHLILDLSCIVSIMASTRLSHMTAEDAVRRIMKLAVAQVAKVDIKSAY